MDALESVADAFDESFEDALESVFDALDSVEDALESVQSLVLFVVLRNLRSWVKISSGEMFYTRSHL